MLKLFALNLTAPQSAEFTNLNIKTINRLYGKFRERIEDLTNEISPIKGEYEADESYFGPIEFVVNKVVVLVRKQSYLDYSNSAILLNMFCLLC